PLERDARPAPQVERLEHDPHAPGAEPAHDLEPGGVQRRFGLIDDVRLTHDVVLPDFAPDSVIDSRSRLYECWTIRATPRACRALPCSRRRSDHRRSRAREADLRRDLRECALDIAADHPRVIRHAALD